MLDINVTKIKKIEELYVVIQCMGIIIAMFISKHILGNEIIFQGHIKMFMIIYLVYSILRIFIVFKNNNLRENIKYTPNFYLAIIDGFFLCSLLFLSKETIDAIVPVLYLYVIFQTILFKNVKSFISVLFISITYIIIKKQTNSFLSLEMFMNICFIFILNIILSLLIKDIRKLGRQIQYMLEDLKCKNDKLFQAASKDYLTNMYNHGSFYKHINKVLNNYKNDTYFCIAIFDIDNFKRINDTYGHLSGDLVIREIAEIMLKDTRKTDVAARYGGDEFSILFPDTCLENGIKICERIRKKIESHYFKNGAFNIKVTLSCGISVRKIEDVKLNEPVEFIDDVDKLLYKAKKCGKNQVKCKKAC